jgi:hypothetical protein
VRADEKLTAFVELESAIDALRLRDHDTTMRGGAPPTTLWQNAGSEKIQTFRVTSRRISCSTPANGQNDFSRREANEAQKQ